MQEELRKRGKAALDKLKRAGKETPAERPKTRAEVASIQKERSRQEGNKKPIVSAPSCQGTAIPPKAKRAPMDRDELRKRGQEALKKLRSNKTQGATHKPQSTTKNIIADVSSNRKKMIEEGRQLLLQAKSSRSASTSKPAASSSSSLKAKPPPPSKPTPPSKASTGKAVKITNDENNDAGWDFDDFGDF